jgi:predicted DNA-binding transcriptional regulator AlpA
MAFVKAIDAATIEREYYYAADLERLTGVVESTWHYYAWAGKGPRSFKLGKRRVWKRSVVEEWLAEQERSADPR